MLTDDILARYHMLPLTGYKERFGDTTETERVFYSTFLTQTDYVAAKLSEAAYLGQAPDEDYTEVLAARQYAREEINKLKGVQNGS